MAWKPIVMRMASRFPGYLQCTLCGILKKRQEKAALAAASASEDSTTNIATYSEDEAKDDVGCESRGCCY